jgi:hypothetical protein
MTTTTKVFSCPFLAWLSLILVASFQLVHIYNLEMNGMLSISSNKYQRFSRKGTMGSSSTARGHKSARREQEPNLVTDIGTEGSMHESPPKVAPSVSIMKEKQRNAQQSAPQFTWNTTKKDATCQVWPKQAHEDPSGIVVTLVLTPDDPAYLESMQQLLCNAIPSQLRHLLFPQQWDLLLIIAGDHYQKALPRDHLIQCLNLTRIQGDGFNKQWHNLDGSTLTTVEYRWQNRVSVFLSEAYHLEWPQYVQQNHSILAEHIDPPICDAPKSYIQGTRWYTNEMLHLQILQNYHYYIKLDIDLYFHKTPPWHLLHDMQTRGALFAHTAALPKFIGGSCTTGIVHAIRSFVTAKQQETTPQLQYCTTNEPFLQMDRDWFYTNFIIGRVDFWTQPLVLELGAYLSNFEPGFFHYRWTDQVVWPQALGMLVGLRLSTDSTQNINPAVVDYTELRCSAETNCWNAVFYNELYGYDAVNACSNGAYFRHTKNNRLNWKNGTIAQQPTTKLWKSDRFPYALKYKDECKERIAKKREEYTALYDESTSIHQAWSEMVKHIPVNGGFKGK